MAVTITELQQYLEPRLTALEKTIRDITEPIVKDIDRLRADINGLFDMDRDTRDRIATVEADVKTLKDDKEDKKMSSQNIIMIIALIATIVVATVGWIM